MDFTEEEKQKLVEAYQQLHIKPKADTKDDLVTWMRQYVTSLGDPTSDVGAKVAAQDNKMKVTESGATNMVTQKEILPRIPIFSGSTPLKSDHVPFEVWHYELQCLVKQKRFSDQAILNAARLSLRGDASKVAVRLGTDATISELIEKMRYLFGTIDSGEELLARFYAAVQTENETVVQWSFRLEDLMEPAIQAGLFTRDSAKEAMRSKFWSGLKHPLRELSNHKYDQIKDYEHLLVEVRKLEKSLNLDDSKSTKQKPAARTNLHHTDSQPDQGASSNATHGEGLTMVQQMKALQAQVTEMATQFGHFKASQQHQQRKTQCWRCGKYGHVQSRCRNNALPLNQYRPAARGTCWQPNPMPQSQAKYQKD